jgi:catechol 2,3-dioxygenase-like lactoylglutathione lyase family enzyme
METQGLNPVHLVVTDLERSARVYTAAFGLEELWREPGRVFLNTPGRPDVLTLSEGDGARLDHIGFLRADPSGLDQAVARAERAGGRVVERHEMEGGTPTAFVEDPDGFVVQL